MENKLELIFFYNQLKEVYKGDLLYEVLEFVEDNDSYAEKITPYIKIQGATYVKENIIPMLKDWLDSELVKVKRDLYWIQRC